MQEREQSMGSSGAYGESFLRQLSAGGESSWSSKSTRTGSRRWGRKSQGEKRRVEEGIGWSGEPAAAAGGGMVAKKRVIVVIDQSSRAKHAMMWALTHVTNKGDLLTLLHVVPPHRRHHLRGGAEQDNVPSLANSLGTLCKACKPEVEVEALVIQGPKLATVLGQVRKLEASVLVLGQGKNPSPCCCLLRSSSEDFVEQCINKADCLTLAVRKQSKGVGGYLISSRWQKNFWLLA